MPARLRSQDSEYVFMDFKRVNPANHEPLRPVEARKKMSARTTSVSMYRPRSYDEEAIADDLAQQLYLHTRHGQTGVQKCGEVCMKSEREIVALLREIRDFVQILVVREHATTSLDPVPPIQRNGRNWLLWGHRTHPRNNNEADETTADS